MNPRRRNTILALVALAAAGCSSGGLVGSLPVVPDPTQAATVVVMRQYAITGSMVTPIITIDGLATYTLGTSEHVTIAVAPGERIVGLLVRTVIGADIRTAVKIRAEAGRTYYVLMVATEASPLLSEISERDAREVLATTKEIAQ